MARSEHPWTVSCKWSLCWSCSKAVISSLLHWQCSILYATEALDAGKIVQTLLRGRYKSWNILYANFSNLLSLSWEKPGDFVQLPGPSPCAHLRQALYKAAKAILAQLCSLCTGILFLTWNTTAQFPLILLHLPTQKGFHTRAWSGRTKSCPKESQPLAAFHSRADQVQGQPEVFPVPWTLHTPKHWSSVCIPGLTRTMLIMKASQTAQTYSPVQEILERNMATPLGTIQLCSISIYLVISSTLLWAHLVVGVFPADLLKKHFLFKTKKQLLIMLP